jgi:hypothetical protein
MEFGAKIAEVAERKGKKIEGVGVYPLSVAICMIWRS